MATPEAEEFAGLLKKLKDRSGRSYGVLAGRLHVSTSTLHRYCNGDAVPGEYAPVERFARLCEATADELVELHRRWILADAARRRGKPDAPVAGAQVPDAVPEADAPVEPAPPPVPAPAPAEPASATEPEPEPVPEVEPHPGFVPEPSSRWRRASARTRVLLAAAAVVALTVPTAVVIGQLKETGSDAAVGVPGGRDTGEGNGADAVSESPESPSASASASVSASASERAGASASAGSASPSVRSSVSASPTAVGGTGGPPTVTISSYNWEAPCGQFYLLSQDPATVPPPPPPTSTRGWARSLGGVDGGSMKLELTVQGSSQAAVVLTGMHVRVLSQRAPVQQPAFSMGEGCGSGIEPQSFDIDLDNSRPTLTPVAGTQGDEVVPAKDFPFRVSSSDVEVFDLDAHVEGHDVSWYLELEWSSGGRTGTLRVDDGGQPFRTSSIAGRPEYYYRYDTSVWEKR
ncbi:XRE family transcriptional regulator [Streptomyces sp. A0958]|uniref:helix-turn-helix domain-containing protein n=1 Tax=Streptomyces sp. A0958 TaxID=2563101 RepID=UPI00109E8D9C|nr:helix-turn-helix transcriptional regulator [Streptomyces sp. A0958]THA70792.1 XRE family transcriptional regulator [Streptomyces sp. A0958]